MIKEFVEAWDKNKGRLEEYFRNTKQEEYNNSYEDIVRKLFEHVINPYLLDGPIDILYPLNQRF